MNVVGLAIYLYAGFLSFIFGFISLYAFIKYSKLERKNKEIIYVYVDNLKNFSPYMFYSILLTFTIVFVIFALFICFVFNFDLYLGLTMLFSYFLIIYLFCFKKYRVEIYKDGFYGVFQNW